MGSAMIVAQDGKLPKHLAASTGKGMENIGADMLTLPRVKLLQDISPEVKKSSDRRIDGAEPGHIMLTSSDDVYDEIFVVNLKLKTGIMAFNLDTKMPFRPMGSEYADGLYPDKEKLIADMIHEGINPDLIHEDPTVDAKTGYQVQESHRHSLLIIDPETAKVKTPAAMDFTRTKVKESKNWNTQIATQGGDRYSALWRISSKVQTWNDYSWYNYDIKFHGWLTDELYAEADKVFNTL